MADTDIVFTGLQYLNGVTVSVCIGGLDCGDYVVALGQITVPITANPGLSAQFIAAISALNLDAPNITGISIADTWYFVPVVIGRKYTSTGQMFRPETQQALKSQTGDGLGHKRRGYQYSFLFTKSSQGYASNGVFSVGTGASQSWPLDLKAADQFTDWTGKSRYEGVHWGALDDKSGFDAMLTWTVSRPVAVTITAAAIHLHSEDR